MKEILNFKEIGDLRFFVHYHIPEISNRKAVLFFNPLFDEKKKVQKFQADTARALCSLGFYVVRFDYFGTGDSLGETYEFDFENTLKDINSMANHVSSDLNIDEIIIIGIRLGCDLALKYSTMNENVKRLLLIAPVLDGNRYLVETRMRRKAFHSLNRMVNISSQVKINEQTYEDFQGYLLSEKALRFLEVLKSTELPLKNKHISIFQVQSLFNKKLVNSFITRFSDDNKIDIFQDDIPEFWAIMEYVNTKDVTQRIVESLNAG